MVAASDKRCVSSASGAMIFASTNFVLNSASKTDFMVAQKGSCHLKTVFFVTTYGVIPAARHLPKKMRARCVTLSRGLW